MTTAAPTVTGIATAIAPAAATERDEVLAVLADAFAHDPFIRWLHPGEEHYRTYFPPLADAAGGVALSCGTADRTADGAGVALWVPPGVTGDDEAMVAVLQAGVPPARHREVFGLIEQIEAHHPRFPHWYLPFIGVSASGRGRGLGSALMAHGLARCDRDGLPAYLEASAPRNRALYERLGFAAIGEIRVAGSPPLWPMLRTAR